MGEAMSSAVPCLLVFVKAPQAGHVKTRLAQDVGPAAAARVYRALADRVIAETRPEGHEYGRLFFFAPAAALAEIRTWLTGETCVAQEGADLGARMAAAFGHAFAAGASRAVLIGSDAPDLSRVHVATALAALADHDLVLGPSTDGGYYLIGLQRPWPRLFEGMPWSTPAVLEQTLDRAREMRLYVHRLGVLSDIDTLSDLRREWPRMARWLPPEVVRDLADRWG
jgi:rSAM/selenodomain-associated transferase 1